MNSRALSYLAIAAVFVSLGAWWMSASRAPSMREAAPLYPALKGKLDAIAGIRVYSAGDKLAVEIHRDGDRFVVAQRANHPADAAKTRRLLMDLEAAKLREEKTSNPANYAVLNVQDVSAADAAGMKLELLGAPEKVELIVGKRDVGARSTYVRRVGEAASWLIDQELDASADPRQWLRRDIVNIAADRIAEVVTELAGERRYAVRKEKRTSPNFDVDALPRGRELYAVSAPNAIAQALVSLQLDDVRPGAELSREKPVAHVTLRTFDGLLLECDGYKQGEQHWIVVKASFDEALAKRYYEADPKAGKEEADKAQQAALQKIRDEAATLNKNAQGWAYAIAGHKYDGLFKPLEQLLKKK